MKKPVTSTTSSLSKIEEEFFYGEGYNRLEEAKAEAVRQYLKSTDKPSYNDYIKKHPEETISKVFFYKLLKQYAVSQGAGIPDKVAAPSKPIAKPAAQYIAPVPKAADPAEAKNKVAAVEQAVRAAGFPLKDVYGNPSVEESWGNVYINVPTGERGPRLDIGGGRDGDDWMEDSRVEQLQTAAEKKYGAKAAALEQALNKAGFPVKIRVDYGEKGHISLVGEVHLPKTMTAPMVREARKMPDLSQEADEEMGDENEMVDTGDEEEMPEEFLFESKMIFLSNLKDIPPAVGDRCISIGLHYTKDQALDLIEHKLDSLCPEYPDLTLAMKKKIVNFMRKHQSAAKRFSFRSFLHIATIYMSGDPNWEQWALIQMSSLPT